MRQFGSISRKTNAPLSWLRRYGLVSILTAVFAMACSGPSPSDSDSDDDGGDDPKLGSAQVFYVATGGGNDADPGTISAPWRTIGHAAATLEPGDTVYVRAGFYAERVIPARSGRADAHIVYLAHPGEEVTIDGRTIALPAE